MHTVILSGARWFGEFVFFVSVFLVVELFLCLGWWLPKMALLIVKMAMPGRSVN